MSEFDAWIGRTVTRTDVMDPWRAHALRATLGQEFSPPVDEAALPCLWHWIYFLEIVDREQLAADGHAKRGGFLPPVDLPRRMYAGTRTTVHKPLQLGRGASLTETVRDIVQKRGGDDPLYLLTLQADYSQDGQLCVSEERDLFFLGPNVQAPAPDQTTPVPEAPWEDDITPDSAMLFRTSALTFNTHRIHYDEGYVTTVEGYPERVVHGPLSALLLAEVVRRRHPAGPATFAFRAQRPLFVDSPVPLRGTPSEDGKVDLAAYDPYGRVAVSAKATLRAG
jgi:3-methylfumaryl-CoA hydratase